MVRVSESHFSYLTGKKSGELKINPRGSIRSSEYCNKHRRRHIAPGERMEGAAQGLGTDCPGLELSSLSTFHLNLRFSVWFRVSLIAIQQKVKLMTGGRR